MGILWIKLSINKKKKNAISIIQCHVRNPSPNNGDCIFLFFINRIFYSQSTTQQDRKYFLCIVLMKWLICSFAIMSHFPCFFWSKKVFNLAHTTFFKNFDVHFCGCMFYHSAIYMVTGMSMWSMQMNAPSIVPTGNQAPIEWVQASHHGAHEALPPLPRRCQPHPRAPSAPSPLIKLALLLRPNFYSWLHVFGPQPSYKVCKIKGTGWASAVFHLRLGLCFYHFSHSPHC